MQIDEFIKNHTHIQYCEALIYPIGEIKYAEPSHNEALIKHYCFLNNCARDDIWNLMDIGDSPIHWLVENTGCIAIWYNFYIAPKEITDEQAQAIAKLITSKTICV